MDYMDLAVCSSRKAVELNHPLTDSILLEAGRGIRPEFCGLDDVVLHDDLGSGPYAQFIIMYHAL